MNISLVGIFLEGLLSFLSPCVLPLLPLYMSYLAGDNKTTDEEGNVKYNKLDIFLSTFCFVLGICVTFALLALAIDSVKDYISNYSEIISIIGGTLVIVSGLHEVGIIHIDVLNKEAKLKVNLHLEKMSFFKAFLLGLVFSIGWSPCIGPMLANALLLAASNNLGYLYIVAYGLGLVIPFLITGLLTSFVLNLIKNKQNIFKWVIRIAGTIMIIFGVYMIYSGSKGILLAKKVDEVVDTNEESKQAINYIYDLEFVDQNDNVIKLSDYDGKYIFINFSATWCTYCQDEMVDFLDFADKNKDCICLYAMNTSNDSSVDVIKNYAKEMNISIPVLIDDGMLNYCVGVQSFPTCLIFGPDRTPLVIHSGLMSREEFDSIYAYAKEK